MSRTDLMSDMGSKPRLEFHPPDKLISDARYQRSVSTRTGKKLIRRIVENFYWPFFGVLVATDNGDGTYCLLDGQHRAEAARQHPRVHSVPVLVIDEMTLAEQARAFVEINRSRISLNPLQIHHAAVRAGDPAAQRIDKIARECDVRILRSVRAIAQMEENDTLAITVIGWIHRSLGVAALRAAFIHGREMGAASGLSALMLRAVAQCHKDGIQDLTARLTRHPPDDWIARAKSRAAEGGGRQIDHLIALIKEAE